MTPEIRPSTPEHPSCHAAATDTSQSEPTSPDSGTTTPKRGLGKRASNLISKRPSLGIKKFNAYFSKIYKDGADSAWGKQKETKLSWHSTYAFWNTAAKVGWLTAGGIMKTGQGYGYIADGLISAREAPKGSARPDGQKRSGPIPAFLGHGSRLLFTTGGQALFVGASVLAGVTAALAVGAAHLGIGIGVVIGVVCGVLLPGACLWVLAWAAATVLNVFKDPAKKAAADVGMKYVWDKIRGNEPPEPVEATA